MSRLQADLDFILPMYPFSHGERENLKLWLGELDQWGFPPVAEWWSPPSDRLRGKDLRKAALKPIEEAWSSARDRGPDWSPSPYRKDSAESARQPISFEEISDDRSIMGSCPVASEKTRCCNLLTLDAVFRCGFDCSYCSIQSFYSRGKISFHGNLREKLRHIEKDLDKEKIYHIGTGQSSDSLMWGNYQVGSGQGLLEELMAFAGRNPKVILELKSKSDNLDWVRKNRKGIPHNVIFTWSLNPPRVIREEEKLTASLDSRLAAAREAADMGLAVGFHFHPMIRYEEWKEDYSRLFALVRETFSPREIVQISFGTLTFIKPVLKKIRKRDFSSQILRMPLEESAGKYTYPVRQKEELFSLAYRSFSDWHSSDIFFYLCMEDKELWEPCLGRSYESNETFEKDMLESYYNKLLTFR